MKHRREKKPKNDLILNHEEKNYIIFRNFSKKKITKFYLNRLLYFFQIFGPVTISQDDLIISSFLEMGATFGSDVMFSCTGNGGEQITKWKFSKLTSDAYCMHSDILRDVAGFSFHIFSWEPALWTVMVQVLMLLSKKTHCHFHL